jgi:ubiquinone/menaquinone biosynthesis C-methylase UbiE
MSFFRWTAPIFKMAGHRWSEEDFQILGSWLRPFLSTPGKILDLAGGTGDLAVGLAGVLGAEVVVLDATAQMLRRVSGHPLVSVREGVAEAMPFPAGQFDALLCSDAFHHFRDQDAAVREMARVVRPGGGVLILEMNPRGFFRPLIFLERMLKEPASFMTPLELERFFSTRGVVGASTRQRGISYSFLGTVVD